MKKIYMILAAMSLLSLSLNAQVENLKTDTSVRLRTATKTNHKDKVATMNELLAGIKGMSSVLHAAQGPTASSSANRAPLRLNSGDELMGPFTTYDTSVDGYNSNGFSTAYGNNYQQIYIFSDLDRSAFEGHDGDEIVGYRFALGGNTSQTAILYDFMAWPYSTNGIFENANRHTWRISEGAGATPLTAFDDIVITVPSYNVMFRSITVYGDNNTVLSSWNADESLVNDGTYDYYQMPDGWYNTSGGAYMFQMPINNVNYGYLSSESQSVLTIDGELLSGQSSVRVVISAISYSGTVTVDVNGDTRNLTTTQSTNTWTFSPSGTTTPIYQELQAGQWYEYYLDEPIPFSVADSIDGMYLGYRFFQYPSTETGQLLNPVAINPNSTNAGIVTYRYGEDGTTTTDQVLTSYNVNTNSTTWPTGWSSTRTISINSGDGSAYLYNRNGGTITIPSNLLQGFSNVKVVINAASSSSYSSYRITVNNSQQTVSGTTFKDYTWNNVTATNGITITMNSWNVSFMTITVSAEVEVPAYRNGWWSENLNGDLAVQLIFKSEKPTPAAPVVTNVVNDNNVAITITPDENTDGDLVYYVIDKDGNQTQDLTFPRGDTDYTVTVHAYTTATDNYNESPEATQTVTIPALPQTAKPVINVEPGDEAYTITATGDGTVTMVVNGTEYHGEGSVTVTIDRGAENQTVVVTATAQETGKRVSEEATQTVTVPYLITDAPVITIERTDEGVIVTATGNGNVTLTVGDQPSQSGQGSVSITLPYGDNEYTVTATATAQETGKHVSDATSKDVVVSPIDDTWSEFTGTYSDDDVINWGKEVMFVDRFSEQLHPSNDHPAKYEYTLVENKDEGKSTNVQIVPVQKPRDVMGGFFTRSQVDNDYDLKLPVDVMNADMEVYLENSNDIYYYAVNRGVNEAPDTVLSKMQRVYNNTYTEIGKYFFNETFSSGIKSRLDTIDVKTGKYGFETGTFNEDYMSYVPIIWTFGHLRTNRRVNFTNDSIHNSYGAPVWYTGVGKVDDFKGEVQRQKGKWSVWTAPDGKSCARFRAHIEAKGYLPTEGHDSINVEYEPYMFRIWVVCDSLRDYTVNSETGYLEDAGAYPSDTMWLADVPCYRIIDGNTTLYDSYLNYGDVDKQDEYVNQLMFGANQGAKPTFIVRFYYRAKAKELPGEEETPAGMMMRKLRSEANAYYAVEDEFNPGDPTVGINEIGLINNATVVNTIYYNAQGMSSNQPFEGFNIIVTRYSDGSTTTDKVFK